MDIKYKKPAPKVGQKRMGFFLSRLAMWKKPTLCAMNQAKDPTTRRIARVVRSPVSVGSGTVNGLLYMATNITGHAGMCYTNGCVNILG